MASRQLHQPLHEAETPRGVWPVAAADQLDLDVTNLGFAANAHLDPFTARAMRDSGADLFSLKVGINIVGGDTMKRRTFVPAVHGFLDTIREGAPTAPILVISPILCPMHEDTPGPTVTDPETGERRGTPPMVPDPLEPPLTLRSVREILRGIVAARAVADTRMFFLDGLDLFGADDIDELPDGLHPSPAGYLRIADRFAAAPVVSAWIDAAEPEPR
ncbi:GDSL-type esterase/lipase family protein [Microbacterium sp. CCNWLW134]|uniref:GDSL-type esterase/lipase family protein n=1 Tax=Microbacterium sp. CCNWLW134 TaxID=3122064 RepID=UPI00300FD4A4